MSAHTLVKFESKNSFKLMDSIKQICNGKARFDKDEKCWMVPQGALAELQRLDRELGEPAKEAWKKACEKCGFRFVKKGTPEYEKVLVVFKQIMKQMEDGQEDEDEEFDMDNAVEVKKVVNKVNKKVVDDDEDDDDVFD
jgi:hypothetical protein